jgi:protein phosphatase
MVDPVKFSSPAGSSEVRVFAVADGLGGHASGEVASQFVLSKLCSSVADLPSVSEYSLIKTLKDLHRSLFNISAVDPEYRGMGATVAGLVVDPAGTIYLFHVGDSRVYRREDRFLQLLTADDRFECGEYGEAEPDIRPTSSLLQCLGGLSEFSEIAPHVARFEMSDAPEMFLVCSDGLSDMISQDEIEESMSESHETTLRTLFERVKATGAKDNVSIMIVELFPQPRPQENPVITPGGTGELGAPV